MDFDPLEEGSSVGTDIKAEIDNHKIITENNVCRFCLTENDPKDMIHIAWDEWENAPLAKMYKLVTSRNVSRIFEINLQFKYILYD